MPSYTIRKLKIVYETLNTEVIIIDFHTGDYYALTHVAKDIWQLIEQQIPLNQMAHLISNHYKCEIDQVFEDVRSFIDQLLENELIELVSEETPHRLTDPLQLTSHNLEYNSPQLQKYTDVQNLLLLDPIHEVTEAGWPDKLK